MWMDKGPTWKLAPIDNKPKNPWYFQVRNLWIEVSMPSFIPTGNNLSAENF
jgi:hypothetical protein